MASIIREDSVGVAISASDNLTIEHAVDALLVSLENPGLSARCVASARARFSLEKGAADYAAIYRDLAVEEAA